MPRFNNDGRSSKFIHSSGGGRKFNAGDHDDRNQFKFTMQQSRTIQRKIKGNAFARLDDDVVMDPSTEPGSSHGRVQFQKGTKKDPQWRRNKHHKRDKHNKDAHSFGPGWHKVTVLHGAAFDKTTVLTTLGQICRVPFIPISYYTSNPHANFYIEDRPTAEALAECSGKAAIGDGKNILLRVVSCGTPPSATIDDESEAKLKAVLASRYNPTLQTLSLENFYMTPELVNDYFFPLFRPSVSQKLTQMIEPLYDTIIGLDLSNNRLPSVDVVQKLIMKLTALKALNLKGNKLRDFHVLDRLTGVPIVELILEGNPLCDKFEDKEAYISAVRKRFPKVVKLDGNDLAPSISFDVTEPIRMPEVRGSSYCNEEAKKVVLRFWELYVTLYDSDDRQPLLDAYHDMASMSMMASYAQSGHVSQMDPSKKLSTYLTDSRNMVRMTEKGRRFKLLHQGKLDIVAFINKLPKTKHDHNSYLIDMPVAVENFILFNVNGIFKERDERSNPIRYFCRSFTLVPQNSGFVIINEMLFITNPSVDQLKNAFRQPAPTPSPSPVPHVQPVPPAATITAPVAPTDEERRQMLILFAQQSGMNEEWSRKCLEENAWDFNKSAFVFTQLKEQNKIPPEAFIK